MASSIHCNHLISSFLLLPHRRTTTTKTTLSFLSSSSSSSPSLRLHRPVRSHSTATAIEVEDSSSAFHPPTLIHPWPEWGQFLDKLKSKGYFQRTADNGESGGGVDRGGGGGADSFIDQNRINNVCLKFARERFDILRSLPKEDIQTVVESGCPNLSRKAVNSAKKLRAFLKLDEGDVCNACILRGACDRAYVIPKEDGGARTVDVMRILVTYAVDPVLQSGVDSPSFKEHVHESARRLLAELTKLSDTTIDPDLPPPSVQHSSKKKPSQKSQKVTIKNKKSQDVEMKRGDWLCPSCNFLNFARNVCCLNCKEDGLKRVIFGGADMKSGDWTCPQCEYMNYARNKSCFRCNEVPVRPKRHLNPGEWECPSCDFLNFRGNKVCKKCNHDGPEADTGSQFDDHAWKSPRKAEENKAFRFWER